MNKKVIIGIISIVVLVTIIIVGIMVKKEKNKADPELILERFIFLANKKDYEGMYNLITEESKSKISREDFLARNKNIYEGIDMSNMKITTTEVKNEDKNNVKISYKTEMDTSIGKVIFENKTTLIYAKEEYFIDWNSNFIFPDLNDTDKVKIKKNVAKRGSILDINGVALAKQDKISEIGIVPGKLGENKEENIEKIAELCGTTSDAINKLLSASWVKDEVFVPIKKVAMNETELKEKLLKIPGVKINSVDSRVYPFGENAAQLVGYVQTITAEELEKNADKGYTSSSMIGKAGLEKLYEERLKGKNGGEIFIEDSEGNKKSEIIKVDVQDGEDITITIDSEVQNKLYNEIKDNKGFFVVMDPKTGAISALVSTPSYDPNKFVLGMSTEEWNKIKDDKNTPMTARFLQTWCPGSTFKPVTGAIGLTVGSIDEDDTFSYEGLSWQKDGSWGNYKITTLTGYNGAKNLKNALIHSDNIYFAQATLKIGKKDFISGLKKVKFGENIDFDLSVSKSTYSNSEDISTETQLADSGYGQGQILVNPIHMASIYSAFENDGNMIKPYIEYKEDKKVEYLVENAFSKEAANTIKEDLIQVVESVEGTAHDMKVRNRTIAGKTGTAELKSSKDEESETLGWFNCFTSDQKDKQFLIVSMVEDGRATGGSHYLISKIKTLFK